MLSLLVSDELLHSKDDDRLWRWSTHWVGYLLLIYRPAECSRLSWPGHTVGYQLAPHSWTIECILLVRYRGMREQNQYFSASPHFHALVNARSHPRVFISSYSFPFQFEFCDFVPYHPEPLRKTMKASKSVQFS